MNAIAVRVFFGILAIVIPVFVAVSIWIPSQRPLAAAAAALPFAMYLQVVTPFLMIRDNIMLVNLRALGQSFSTAVWTIPLVVFTNLGLNAVIAVWVFFYIVAAAQSWWAMRPIIAASPPSDVDPREIMREQVHFGLRAAGGSTAGFMNMRVSILVVSVMFAPAALGWYTLAIGTGELLWQVSRAFIWSAVGRIGSDPFPDAAALVARVTRNTLAIVGSLGVAAFIFGPWLIVHIYGEGFAPAGAALRWALPGLTAYAAEVAITKFIVLQLGRPTTAIWVQSGGTLLCATCSILLAHRFGIVGAAASTSVTYLIVTWVLVKIFVDGTGIPLRRLLVVQQEDLRHYIDVVEGMLRTLRLRSA